MSCKNTSFLVDIKIEESFDDIKEIFLYYFRYLNEFPN